MNTFDEVAERYASIAPIRSARGKLWDIRPLGGRAKHEQSNRIVKIDNNTYVISDGYHAGDGAFGWYPSGFKKGDVPEHMVLTAPIVWRRDAAGVETVTVRNAGFVNNTVHTRHTVLRQYLPAGIELPYHFSKFQGKHALIFSTTEGKRDTFFPASRACPEDFYDFYKSKPTWKSYLPRLDRGDDGRSLTFRRRGDFWDLPKGRLPFPVTRVDTEAKAKHREAIAQFREWCLLMLPMVLAPGRSWEKVVYEQRIEARRDLETAMKARNEEPSSYGFSVSEALALEIVTTPEHELRVSLAIHLYEKSDASTMKEFGDRFARNINKTCGFLKVVEV